MVYGWKIPGLYSVSAQAAGEELERIYQERGKIDPADVVDESRPEGATLHPCFEWRDDIAAEEWRKQQARNICCCIVAVREQDGKEPVSVRAVFNVQGSYHPAEVIVRDADKYNDLCRSALRELEAFRRKYLILSDREELRSIFSAIDEATEKEKAPPAGKRARQTA